MATILGLALKINADATAVPAALTPVERALRDLDREATRVTGVFDAFAESSAAAADVQQRFQSEIKALTDALNAREISGQQFADGFAAIRDSARELADVFAEGARVTEANRTEEDLRAATLERLQTLLDAGAISEETYARAKADASGESARLAQAEVEAQRARSELIAEAARVTESVTTEQEKRQTSLDRLKVLIDEGVISEETYNRAVAKTSGALESAERAERARQRLLEEGSQIQKRYGDQTRATADEIARLLEIEEAGGIDIVALNRAAIERLGINERAAESAKQRADAVSEAERQQAEATARANEIASRSQRERAALEQEAQRIREASLSTQQRAQLVFDRAIERARVLEQAGVLTKQEFNQELQRQADNFAKVTVEAANAGRAIEQVAEPNTLRFRELSGALAILPGPLGGIAGRISGITSAGEGLARVFSGGLTAGFSAVGRAAASIVNPFAIASVGIAGLGTASAAVASGLNRLEDEVERLGNTADKLGVSFEFIQTLSEAARRSGTSIDAVSGAFGRLQRSVLGVDEESKSAQKALERLGITAEDLQGKRPEEQYLLLGRAIGSIADPARRSAVAVDLFGKSGADLLPFFNNVGAAATDLERFGATLATSQRRDVDAFGAAMDRLSVAAKGAGDQLFASFATAGEAIASSLAEATGAVTRFISEQNRAAAFSRELQKLRREYTGVITDSMLAAIRDGKTADEVLGRATSATQLLKDSLEDTPSPEFAKVAEDIRKKLEDAKLESAQFGQAGFNAALKFQEAIARLRSQLDSGVFNEETFRREAERAGAVFKEELRQIEADAKLDIQVTADAGKTLDGLREKIGKAIGSAEKFGKAGFDAAQRFQGKLNDLGAQFDDGRINATSLANEVEKASSEYDKQIEKLKQTDELQKSIIKVTQDRVKALIEEGRQRTELDQRIEDVLAEQLRVEDQLRKAREANEVFAADAAAARLAQLDQLSARLTDQQKAIDSARIKASEFGEAGLRAAKQFAQGVSALQERARLGFFNKAEYDAELARLQAFFAATLRLEQENQRLIAESKQSANERIEALLRGKIDQRTRFEISRIEEIEKRERQALENVRAIRERIAVTERSIAAAREIGDLKSARARSAELRLLKQAEVSEQRIADGRIQQQREVGQQFLGGISQAQQFQGLIAQQNDNFLRSFNNTYAGANQALAANAAAAAEQAAKLERLLTPTNQLATTADIRTQEGQQLLLDVANQGIDPRLVEARLQTKQLNRIAAGISQAASNYFNAPVSIVGGAALG